MAMDMTGMPGGYPVQSGPSIPEHYAAYDNVMQAVSGVMDLNGFPDGVPQKIGPAIGDSYSGLVLLLGITIAYYRKLRTGQGCRVDATMLGSLITALEYPVMEYTDCGKLLHRDGNRSPWYAPGDVYRAKDSYVALSVKTDAMWQTFLERTGFPAKAGYQTAALRLENRDALKTDLEAFLKDTTGKELEAHRSLTVQEVWKEQLTLGRKKFHLNRQEYEELLEFGGMLGYLDIQMQTELCLWYEERLKISVQTAMSEAGEKRRLYRCLGILSGVVLAVFII